MRSGRGMKTSRRSVRGCNGGNRSCWITWIPGVGKMRIGGSVVASGVTGHCPGGPIGGGICSRWSGVLVAILMAASACPAGSRNAWPGVVLAALWCD